MNNQRTCKYHQAHFQNHCHSVCKKSCLFKTKKFSWGIEYNILSDQLGCEENKVFFSYDMKRLLWWSLGIYCASWKSLLFFPDWLLSFPYFSHSPCCNSGSHRGTIFLCLVCHYLEAVLIKKMFQVFLEYNRKLILSETNIFSFIGSPKHD